MSAGRVLAAGGAAALVFNVLFPRAADPWDPVAVLTMMAESPLRRQTAFVGVTVAVVLIAGSVMRLGRRSGTAFGDWGAGLVGAGALLFTVASALGLAATGSARAWLASGSSPESAEFAIAAALNRADDFVWYLAIATLWTGLGLIGLALRRTDLVPAWAGPSLAVLGLVTGIAIGIPLAVGTEWLPLVIGFGALAGATSLWALAVGLSVAREEAG
ncbi:MAG TPA: hypothetical protein VLB67_03565 [Acidimicrobiia bacterium]|nr:hypothetical protein [Acidimicrobiia bacterium]